MSKEKLSKQELIKQIEDLTKLNKKLKSELASCESKSHIDKGGLLEDVFNKKEFFKTVIESLNYPFFVINPDDYTIIYKNSCVYTRKLKAGTKCYELTHKFDKPCGGKEHLCPVDEALKTKNTAQVIHTHYDQNGNMYYAEVHATPLIDKSGKVLMVMEYSFDITERVLSEKALRESEAKIRMYLENSPDPVFVVNAKGDYIEVNKAACEFSGYSREELLTMTFVRSFKEEEVAYRIEQFMNLNRTGYFEDEVSIVKKDGSQADILLSASKISDNVIIGFVKDITDRKKMETALKESETFTKDILNSLNAHIAVLDCSGNIVSVNEAWKRFARENDADSDTCYVGTNYLKVIEKSLADNDGEDIEKILDGIMSVMNGTKTFFSAEYPCHSEEKKRWFLMRVTPLSGEKAGVVVSHVDITLRILAEESKRKNEERFRRSFENASVGMFMSAIDGEFVMVNDAMCRLTGYFKEELVGMNCRDLTCSEDWDKKSEYIKRLLEGEIEYYNIEKRYIHKDGHIIWVIINVTTISDEDGNPAYFIGQAQDITEKKEFEESLLYNEEELSAIFSNAPLVMLLVNAKLRVVKSNRAAAEAADADKEKQMGAYIGNALKCVNALTNPKGCGFSDECHKCEIRKIIKDTFKKGKPYYRKEASLLLEKYRPHTLFFLISTTPISIGNERLVLVTIEDITERRIMQNALAESEELFRTVVEASQDGKISINSRGRITLFNFAAERIFGWKKEEAVGQFPDFLIPENFREQHRKSVADFFNTEKSSGAIGKTLELSAKHKDGRIFPIELSLSEGRRGKEKFVLAVIRDITGKKQAENELRAFSQKLREKNQELRQFAYIASHDLREPLRMITSYIQLLDRRYKGKFDKDGMEFMDYIIDGAKRMDDMIASLLQYSREESRDEEFDVIDINELVSVVIDNLKIAIEESGAVIEYSNLPVIRGDRHRLIQLFQNLIDNAIKYRKAEVPLIIGIKAEEKNGEYIFMVEDNGIGIEPQFYERIFKIFQRLHSRSQYGGTGIGLAICRKAVERHGGRIWVESEPGQGSKFSFSIPLQTNH